MPGAFCAVGQESRDVGPAVPRCIKKQEETRKLTKATVLEQPSSHPLTRKLPHGPGRQARFWSVKCLLGTCWVLGAELTLGAKDMASVLKELVAADASPTV